LESGGEPAVGRARARRRGARSGAGGGGWGKRRCEAHHPLCIFDEKALGRWREFELPAKVQEQAERGGFLANSDTIPA
jgi:hypothetical protein